MLIKIHSFACIVQGFAYMLNSFLGVTLNYATIHNHPNNPTPPETTHHHSLPPTTSQNISTTIQQPPAAKIYPPPPTAIQNISK